jgi:hypothetical protein
LTSSGIVYGRSDAITVNNQSLLSNNSPAVLIEGAGARVINTGELRLGGNNSPGIEIRGDDAYFEHTGFIHSQYAGSAAEAEPGHAFGNNEGISVNGLRANVKINGRYEGRAGNADFVSLAGNDITLNEMPIAQTYGIQSEMYSISGLKGDEPALGFSANIQGQYITHDRESEFVSITSIGGTLEANATFDSFGNQSEGYSISGKDITAKIAGAVTTRGKVSEGVSLSKLANGTGGNLTATITADLTTEGDDSEGISLQANNSSLTVISEIRTSGRNSEGISVTGQGISFGSTDNLIETQGYDSEGISLTGTGPQLIDASIGSLIRTTGDDSEGISIMGNNVFVDLSSHIFSNGVGSAGFLIQSDNINVILRGAILTYGEGSPGITIEGNHISVEISGSIATSGKDSPVILVRGGSDITIDSGSDASFTASQSPIFSNPSGVHVDGNFPQSG